MVKLNKGEEFMEKNNKLYYVLGNKKQTLICCTLIDKEISEVLKHDGTDWVPDLEVDQIIKKCYSLDLMSKIATKIPSEYELRKVLKFRAAERELAEKQENNDSKNTDTKK